MIHGFVKMLWNLAMSTAAVCDNLSLAAAAAMGFFCAGGAWTIFDAPGVDALEELQPRRGDLQNILPRLQLLPRAVLCHRKGYIQAWLVKRNLLSAVWDGRQGRDGGRDGEERWRERWRGEMRGEGE